MTDFGCNLEAVERTAGQLREVLDELRDFTRRDDAYAGALASQRIQRALDQFHEDSSDQRKKITGSVDALQRMLQGLVDGVREVDRVLALSLPDVPADQAVVSAQGERVPAGGQA